MAKAATTKVRTTEDILASMEADGLQIGLGIPEQNWYSTGNMAIDLTTGGGVPAGRISTFAGPHASGKTTTAVSTARSVIESGRRVLFCDYERTLDVPYFRNLGVDPEDRNTFVRYNPKTLEEGFNNTRELVNTGDFGLVIFDSVAKMLTDKERTSDVSSGMNLEKAKLLRAALSQANDYAFDNDTSVILLNHLLEKVDITFMGQQMAARGIKQYTMPGGTGPQFYSSLILWFNKKGAVQAETFDPITNTETKQKIGFHHTVTVSKNKVGKPDGIVDVINILGEGFSNSRTAFEVLKAYGIVRKSGSWFSVKDENMARVVPAQVQGEENFYSALFDNPEGRGYAISKARELLIAAYENLDSEPDKDAEDENE